jgi:transcriptional regulator with XRE-family HTH domain
MQAQDEIVLIRLGKNLRRLRERNGWTLRMLASRSNIDNSKISKIEKGLINITVITLIELSVALGVTPAELLNPRRRK